MLLMSQSLNNFGIAEDQPIQLSATVGSYFARVNTIIAATYSGDGNYASNCQQQFDD